MHPASHEIWRAVAVKIADGERDQMRWQFRDAMHLIPCFIWRNRRANRSPLSRGQTATSPADRRGFWRFCGGTRRGFGACRNRLRLDGSAAAAHHELLTVAADVCDTLRDGGCAVTVIVCEIAAGARRMVSREVVPIAIVRSCCWNGTNPSSWTPRS